MEDSMGAEYGPAIDMFTPQNFFGGKLDGLPGSELSIVDHKTACGSFCSATDVANSFADPNFPHSTHFVVGRDGSVIQVVHLVDGAWGNCCLEQGHDPYWDSFASKYGNLNFCTISIEHEDWTSDNSQVMTQAQIDASFTLNLWLCQKFGIPPSHIKGHNTLDPISRARCPGPTYPMNQLISYVEAHVQNPPTPPPQPTAAQLAAAKAIFTAIIPTVRTGTGIYNMWLTDYLLGRFHGPALSAEMPYTNWNGETGVVQIFPGGQYEWIGGVGLYYPYH
jgi:hypothetical protein